VVDENATQRANTGTAQVGTVAAALRFLAKAILTDDVVCQKNFLPVASLCADLEDLKGNR
jgi:hypothetical protein